MKHMTANQQEATVDWLAGRGWTFDIDHSDPRPGYRGWWLHSELRPRRTGDSQRLHYAAEIAFNVAGYDVADLEIQPAWARAYAGCAGNDK